MAHQKNMADTDPVVVYINYLRHSKNANFNLDYYINKHIPITQKHWGPLGMQGCTVMQFPDDDPSGLFIQTSLRWKSLGDWNKALEALPNNQELMEDLDHYYADRPEVFLTRYVGKLLAESS